MFIIPNQRKRKPGKNCYCGSGGQRRYGAERWHNMCETTLGVNDLDSWSALP